jgi:hypothetical protein
MAIGNIMGWWDEKSQINDPNQFTTIPTHPYSGTTSNVTSTWTTTAASPSQSPKIFPLPKPIKVKWENISKEKPSDIGIGMKVGEVYLPSAKFTFSLIVPLDGTQQTMDVISDQLYRSYLPKEYKDKPLILADKVFPI